MRRWCWHKRTKWTDIQMRSQLIFGKSATLDGQERRCVKCNKAWRRKIRVAD